MARIDPAHLNQQRIDFARELTTIKDRAARLGLWRTMHALDRAIQEIGWEIANDPKGRDRYIKARDG